MLENLYTTKMSMDKKKLQNRFTKIRSKNGRISKLIALIIFAVILLVMACVTIIIAVKVNPNGYYMTGNEFYDYINRPIGAVMADIDYADDNKIVFHYGEGFFIDNLQTEEIDHSINLKRLDIAYNQQGSSVLEIKIDKAGKYAYLSTVGPANEIKGYEKYIINLDNGEVKKGTMPENAELFTGIADTFTTVQNPVGWYSNNCIVSAEKTYYLTSEAGKVIDIQLVTIHHNIEDMTGYKYVFSKYYVSDYRKKQALVQETLSDDEEILINSGLSWKTNADAVKSVINKLSETRQMKSIDIKDGNFDITIYQIWKNDISYPRIYVIDNKKLKLLFSSNLSEEDYTDIVSILNQPANEFQPDGIYDIKDVELVAGSVKYPLRDKSKLAEIEKAFSTATMIKMGGTACPFDAELIFTRNDGEKGCVTIATDSCAVYKSRDTYYDYGEGDNSMLLGYFGLDAGTLYAISKNSMLYEKTSQFLKQEFYRVYEQYYDIQRLTISNWQENGNEATFFYKMTYLNYNRDPDTVKYIQEAKERGQEEYETLYNDYLALKEGNYQFKVVLNGDNIELYSNVAPKGTEWVPTKIDDYIISNWR